MIQHILFPDKSEQTNLYHFYRHRAFLLRFAEYAGIKVEIVRNNPRVWMSKHEEPNEFSILVDGKQLIVDFSDLLSEGVQHFRSDVPYVKYYYYDLPFCKNVTNLYPIGSQLDIQNISFGEFFEICEKSTYTAKDDIVLCNQFPHTRALERRTYVQSLLKSWYGKKADTTYIPTAQEQFWKKVQDCFISVVVPGCCNSAIDRGHL